MNVAFLYWDFLFTLIYNLSLGRWVAEGIYRNVRHRCHARLRGHLLRADAPEGLLRQTGELRTLHALETSGL
jgi:hypothetical protein